jgi:hypothetical protein
MFSIKQFILNMSTEARKELRELLDYIENNLAEQNVAPVQNSNELNVSEVISDADKK